MQEVVVAYRQLRERMLGAAAKVLRKARPLEGSEERGVVRAAKGAPAEQEGEEEPPAPGVPLSVKERTLRLDRLAGGHLVKAGARVYEDAHGPDEHANEALRHA